MDLISGQGSADLRYLLSRAEPMEPRHEGGESAASFLMHC
jgi:hypothetical protein